jgi:hypothetical protein
MLERPRHAGEQPVTLAQLRASGIDFPAVVIGELELNGYVIERVHVQGRMVGMRLRETARVQSPTPRRHHRRSGNTSRAAPIPTSAECPLLG